MVGLFFVFQRNLFDRQITGLEKQGRNFHVIDIKTVERVTFNRQILKFHDLALILLNGFHQIKII